MYVVIRWVHINIINFKAIWNWRLIFISHSTHVIQSNKIQYISSWEFMPKNSYSYVQIELKVKVLIVLEYFEWCASELLTATE